MRGDAALKYLFHARAVDFHGDARLLKLMTSAGVPEDIDYGFDAPNRNSLNLHIPAHIKNLQIWYELQPVQDKNSNVFDPPATFLNKPLFDRSATALAELALGFYKELIVEAESLSA